MKFSLTKFTSNKHKGLECLNCGQPLLKNENFCSYCGQKNVTNKLSLSSFINSLFEGFLSYDSRFWNTFLLLLTKPGKVSKDYVEGKRARFVNPFQLYLNISIIFFLIVGISTKFSSDSNDDNVFINTKTAIDSISQKEKIKLDSILSNVNEINPVLIDSSKTKIVTDMNTALALLKNDTSKVKRIQLFYKKRYCNIHKCL